MTEVLEKPLEKPVNGLERPANGDRPSGRKRRVLPFVLMILLAGVGWAAHRYWQSRFYETTDDAFVEGHIVPMSPKVAAQVVKVRVNDNQLVKKGDVLVELDARDYDAKLKSAKAALAAAEARAKAAVATVDVTRTTTDAALSAAEAGVKLAEAAIATSKAGIESAKSRREEAQAAVATAEAALPQARAEVTAAEAEAVRTEADLKRFRELLAANSSTQQQLEYATAASASAAAHLEAARKRVVAVESQIVQAKVAVTTTEKAIALAESQLGESNVKLEQAKAQLASAKAGPQQVAVSQGQADTAAADVDAARAAVEQADLNLSYTIIRAPETGYVTRKNVEEGAYVQVGQPLLAVVQPDVWIVGNFKETQLADMRTGQKVEIEVDAFSGMKLEGKVDSIQSGTGARFSLLPPENATGNYVKVVQRVPVKIVIDQLPGGGRVMAPGMSVVPKVKVR